MMFPKHFNQHSEYWFTMREKLIEQCKLLAGEDNKYNTLQSKFNNLIKPLSFENTRESSDIEYDLSFETMCSSLRSHSPNKDVKELTVTEAYSLIEMLAKWQKKQT